MNRPVVYAHRGASGYAVENTIPSFELAIKMKADAVEFDVQLLSDGEVVVFHDFDLNRLFSVDRRISVLTAKELGRYTFPDAGIPMLAEVLEAIGHRIAMNIELKSQSDDPSVLRRLCKRVLELVEARGLIHDVVVSSFNREALRQMRELSDEISMAVLVGDLSTGDAHVQGQGRTLAFYIKTARDTRSYAINMSYTSADARVVQDIHSAGFQVNVYTINDDDLMRTVLRKGADGFFTNYPDRAVAVVRRIPGMPTT
ncbi:MAG: glycerophosphodiester phosphodiesterase [Deltaproteobacteria bacterium]|nr:glycerophosphodiester phosphodiesterase [Deltaproteobacteria bacterium]MCL5277251.1 glycerophosphodiester phosphodiesterase [Deltaproteobacteria bacterium]